MQSLGGLAEPRGFSRARGLWLALTFVTVDAIEPRGADAEAGCDAEPTVHAARSTQC